jgi:hypothetical protein
MSQSEHDPAETTPAPPSGDALEAAPVAPTPDTLLTRSEAARELGNTSQPSGAGSRNLCSLPPSATTACIASHAASSSSSSKCASAPAPRASPAPADYDDGVITAAVFEMFAQGLSPQDVVVQKKLPAAADARAASRLARDAGGVRRYA